MSFKYLHFKRVGVSTNMNSLMVLRLLSPTFSSLHFLNFCYSQVIVLCYIMTSLIAGLYHLLVSWSLLLVSSPFRSSLLMLVTHPIANSIQICSSTCHMLTIFSMFIESSSPLQFFARSHTTEKRNLIQSSSPYFSLFIVIQCNISHINIFIYNFIFQVDIFNLASRIKSSNHDFKQALSIFQSNKQSTFNN